jgi:carboxyl-terminal processing protease
MLALISASAYFAGYVQGYAGKFSTQSFATVFNERFFKPNLGTADFNLFWSVAEVIEQKFDGAIDYRNLLYGAIKGMVYGLDDPYSEFSTKEESKQFLDVLDGRYDGIGIEIEMVGGLPVVISPLGGSPASSAGVKPKDVILSIDGKPTNQMTPSEIVSAMRGLNGTQVELELGRGEEVVKIKMTRTHIKVPSVELKVEDDIAIVTIRKFSDDTSALFNRIAGEILAKNPKGIILDMRNNPGGLFDKSVEISNEFLSSGLIVEQRFKTGKTVPFSADGKGRLTKIPLAVLVDGGSASASEIVAGALQDNNRAKIVGEQTFGKGSIQELDEFADGSSIKLTIGKWYTPSGKSISSGGIKPDVEVKRDDKAIDNQIAEAKKLLLSK